MRICQLQTRGWLLTLVIASCLAVDEGKALTTCPDPPNRVSVTVMATVTFDPATQLHLYQYEVASDAASAQPIDRTALDFEPPIQDIMSPRGWTAGPFDDRNTLGWHAFENVEPAPGDPDTGDVLPPLFPITPGTAMTGFAFKSPNPPGTVKFYATGFTPLPSAPGEMEVEQQLEACPSIAGSFFDLAVSGTTQGPVKAPSVVAIAIDIKPGSAPNSINPASKGVLPVAILTTSSFDAASVDLGTVRFGPGQAQEAHGTEHSEDVDGDGDTDLVLHFATQDTGIHCGDTEATLTGRTISGQPIQGTDAIATVSCK